jgi:glycosyltransferase involved in cell wall biosynthesis
MALALGAHPGRVRVVPNGVAVDEIPAPCYREANGHATVGWVGSFGAWHGAEVAVRAMSRLPAEVRLVMIGDGPGRESCRTLATDLGVDDRIEWTGAVPHELAVDRLGACDVLVSPHVGQGDRPFFGSPTKIFEYMAVGRPIVASRLEQIGEILEDGRTARLVEPGDPDDLAAAVAGVLASADRGRALGLAARREAAERHRWDQRAAAILATLAPGAPGVVPREETP